MPVSQSRRWYSTAININTYKNRKLGGMFVAGRRTGLSILGTFCDRLAFSQQSLEFPQNGAKSKNPLNSSSAGGNALPPLTTLKGYGKSNNHSLQLQWGKKNKRQNAPHDDPRSTHQVPLPSAKNRVIRAKFHSRRFWKTNDYWSIF